MVLEQHLGVRNVLQHADKDDRHVPLLSRDTLLRVIVAGDLLMVRIIVAIESLKMKYNMFAVYLCNCARTGEDKNQNVHQILTPNSLYHNQFQFILPERSLSLVIPSYLSFCLSPTLSPQLHK